MKKEKYLEVIGRGLAAITVCILSMNSFLFGLGPVLIKDPKPTHFEKNLIKLVLVHEIPADFDNKNFIARPEGLKVDNEGNIFIYDDIQNKILIFDSQFRFKRMFGDIGRGPGDWGRSGVGSKNLYIGKDNLLYVGDFQNRKILVYNKEGVLKKEIYFPFPPRASFFPVVDIKGNCYIHSQSGGAVDVYDNKMKKISTLLNANDYLTYLIHIPVCESNIKSLNTEAQKLLEHTTPDDLNTFYDVFSNNGFIIYLAHSSTAYIYRDNKLVKQFSILPQKAVEAYKERVEMKRKKLKSENFYMPMLTNFFVDRETEKYFYLSASVPKGPVLLYKFDFNGQLIAVYYSDVKSLFVAKWKNFFFVANSDGSIQILKENK